MTHTTMTTAEASPAPVEPDPARSLDDLLAAMTPEARERVLDRARELDQQIDGLKALRRRAGLTQAALGQAMGRSQPTVQQIENSEDMLVSTLRRYISAAGGELDLVATLPGLRPFRIAHLGERLWADKTNVQSDDALQS